jgi:thiamine-phosphate pyrophosphorylase
MLGPPPLLLVTDRGLTPSLPRAVEAALAALPPGAAWVQLREKGLPARALLELARALLPLCRARGAKLLINDRSDVALAAGADGVHLAEGSV